MVVFLSVAQIEKDNEAKVGSLKVALLKEVWREGSQITVEEMAEKLEQTVGPDIQRALTSITVGEI